MTLYSEAGSKSKAFNKGLPTSLAWSLLDDLDVGVIVAEIGGLILYSNRAARELLGGNGDELTLAELQRSFGLEPPWQAINLASNPTRSAVVDGLGLNVSFLPYDGHDELIKILVAPVDHGQAEVEKQAESDDGRLEFLLDANTAVSGLLEEQAVLSEVGSQLLRAAHAHAFSIYEWERENDCLIVVADYCDDPGVNTLVAGLEHPLENALLAKEALTSSKTIVVSQAPSGSAPLVKRPWMSDAESNTHVLIPLVMSEETFGLAELVIVGEPVIEPSALELLNAIARQGSSALETALLFEDLYERERFYNALGRVSLAMNFTLAREKVLSLIASESLRIFGVDGAYIWQLEDQGFVGQAAAGRHEEAFPGSVVKKDDDGAFITAIARSGVAVFKNNLDETARTRLRLPAQGTIVAALGVPIEQEGDVTGILLLVDRKRPFRFTNKDVNQASVLGAQVSMAMRNASLFEELRTLNEDLDLRVAQRTQALNEESNRVKILLRITSELSASLDHERVLNQALQLVREVVEATEGVIMLINPETDELDFRAELVREGTTQRKGLSSGLKRDKGLAGWMIDNRSAVIVPDTREDARWIDLPRSRLHRSVLGVPLITGEEVIGVLMLFHSETNAFTSQQLDLVEAAAIQVASAISNANLYLLIRDQAESLGSMLLTEQIEAAKNQSILESIADGVLVADAESRIVIANRAASFILELSSDRLIGGTINELLGVYGQADKSWMKVIGDWATNADLIEQGVFLADELNIEDKVISVHLSPVLAGSQFFGTVSVFRDITKNVEVDRLKGEFVSTVSHELRTPMTSIKGYTDLILMGAAGDISEPVSRYMQVIRNNAERLHMLVNDLLDISRIETAKTALNLRPTDMTALINQVVEGHVHGRIQHENRVINISVDTAPALPLVNADADRVTQILTNLLDNAMNYTPAKGEISVVTRSTGAYVRVSISDTGIGIAKEIQPKIFDRFFRSEEAIVQNVPGTGLGLSIVSKLITMHDGTLEVDSTPNEGSTFSFTLPVVLEDSEPA